MRMALAALRVNPASRPFYGVCPRSRHSTHATICVQRSRG